MKLHAYTTWIALAAGGVFAPPVAAAAETGMPGGGLELAALDGAGAEIMPAGDARANGAVSALDTVTIESGGNLLRFSVSPTAAGEGGGGQRGLDGAATDPGLLYFTPRVASFDLGLGRGDETCKFISPDIAGASCFAYDASDAEDTEDTDPNSLDRFTIGVAYQKRVRALDLGVSSTMVSSAKDSDGLSPVAPELQSWKLDFSAGYTGFTFSTSYFDDRTRSDGQPDRLARLGGQEVFDLGVKYDQGPWAFGVQYSHTELDALNVGADLRDQGVDAYEIGGSYLMGPRLSLGAAVQFWKWDEFAGQTLDEDHSSDLLFLVGSHFKF